MDIDDYDIIVAGNQEHVVIPLPEPPFALETAAARLDGDVLEVTDAEGATARFLDLPEDQCALVERLGQVVFLDMRDPEAPVGVIVPVAAD